MGVSSRPRKRKRTGSERARRRTPVWEPWELDAWKPPPEDRPDEWAERTIMLPPGVSSSAGPLSLDLTPYLREPLRTLTDPDTEEVTICKSTQIGGTLFNILAALYYPCENPWNVMVVMPREDDATSICVERFQPIIQESPDLRKLLGSGKKEMKASRIRMNGVTITFSWATSPAAISSRPVCVLIMDELDKFPAWSGKEADPVKLSRERTRTFHNRKIVKTSTPTTDYGYIWRELKSSTDERFHVPCPHCDHFRELVFGSQEEGAPGIKWPKDERDGDRIVEKRLAWYECASCHGRIEDRHKMSMLRNGVWVPTGSSLEDVFDEKHPPRRRRGFHIWAAYSPWLTFSEIVAEFLDSMGSRAKLMNFVNSWLGQPWKEKVETIEDQHLISLKRDHDRGVVPAGVKLLTAGVDIQTDHIWYAVRGWGLGETSWLVREGSVLDWEALTEVLFASYPIERGGGSTRIQRVLIDSGHKAFEVYSFCRKHRPITVPSKGRGSHDCPKPMNLTRPHPGVLLVNFNAVFWKDKLVRHIMTPKGDPGEFLLHREIDVTYRQHMLSERRVLVKKGHRHVPVWEPVSETAPNHLWDCEVLNVVAADFEGVRYLGTRAEFEKDESRRREPDRREESESDDWIAREDEWLSE